MFDTGDHSDNFTFNELVISIESNSDGFSSGEIRASERLIYYEHLFHVADNIKQIKAQREADSASDAC
jgi:hypothetical protein